MPVVYLIPSPLHETGLDALPNYILTAVKDCQELFVENERTARRFLKQLDKSIIIDDFNWHTISDSPELQSAFRSVLKEKKNVGIISEAGCPGIADPGQYLVGIAHEMNVKVHPLVGPNSMTLALMASGLNGQHFRFVGYLPIDQQQRIKAIHELEAESGKKASTVLFIETPYRNNQLLESLLKHCRPSTRLCIAADLTGNNEWISTRKISEWKKNIPDLHKRPVIFLLQVV